MYSCYKRYGKTTEKQILICEIKNSSWPTKLQKYKCLISTHQTGRNQKPFHFFDSLISTHELTTIFDNPRIQCV